MKLAISGNSIQFTFADEVEGLTFDASKVTSENVKHSAMILGFSNKLRDCAALERKRKDGTIIAITEQMRRDAVLPMITHLESGGEWAIRAAKVAAENPTIRKIANSLGITYSEAEAEIARRMLAELS
jgi:hypothetical protein